VTTTPMTAAYKAISPPLLVFGPHFTKGLESWGLEWGAKGSVSTASIWTVILRSRVTLVVRAAAEGGSGGMASHFRVGIIPDRSLNPVVIKATALSVITSKRNNIIMLWS
jgi:hypothetical protein